MLKPWEILSQRIVYRMGPVEMKEEICQHPTSGIQAPFFRFNFLDWVNVVPLTPTREVVMIRQFRKGIHGFTLEIPGGTLDPGEKDPKAAGLRELAEETGYTTPDLTYLGWAYANPAIQNNRCHFFLAENVTLTQEPHLDTWEEIELLLIPWEEIPARIDSGEMSHSLGVLALMRAAIHLGAVWTGRFSPVMPG